MIQELNAANALAYLEHRGIHLTAASVEELGGGVSNTVLMVQSDECRLVLKQSLGQLRVKEEWLAGRERIFRESSALQKLAPILPAGSLPQVLFEDHDNYIYAMSAAARPASPWKDLLLRGEIDPATAAQVGLLLARMVSATWRKSEWEQCFGDQTIFDQLRLDPYYRATARRHPDLADRAFRLIEESAARRVALTHGDWSPKNFLVDGDKVMAIDFEVIRFGDPTFDSAFLLNHLVLKSFHKPEWKHNYMECAAAFWRKFLAGIPSESWIEPATLRHLGWLLLARIDGKSPAEYLRDSEIRNQVRRFARGMILTPPKSVEEVFAAL